MTDQRTPFRVNLNLTERHKLNVWVTEHQGALNGMRQGAAAALATNALGFVVTPTNLRTTRKAVSAKFRLVSDKPPTSHKAGASSTSSPTYKDLAVLASAITELYSAFGVELPYAVREVTARFSNTE